MTKYSCRKNGEGIALFRHNVPLSAIIDFATTVYKMWKEDVDVIDLDTGEIIFLKTWDEIPDDVDESFYDPYLGCDIFE